MAKVTYTNSSVQNYRSEPLEMPSMEEMARLSRESRELPKVRLSVHPDTDVIGGLEVLGFQRRYESFELTGIPIVEDVTVPVGFLKIEEDGQPVKLKMLPNQRNNLHYL